MNLTFAVLVDGENASYTDYGSLLEEVEKYGTVAIKWVYADWTSVRHGNWQCSGQLILATVLES